MATFCPALSRIGVFLSALFYEVKGLEPEEKYFLVRFIQHFGREEPMGLGVKALAKQFGLSDRQVTASLEELVECGVMTFSSTPAGKGRRKKCYRLQEVFYTKLNEASTQPTTQHTAAVASLLKHESKKVCRTSEKTEPQKEDVAPLADLRSKKQPGQLSVVNRLLLSVLLCRADRFGVVSDLGSSALCKITGLSTERLRNRVQRLIDQGLIRIYVPGATSTVFFTKIKSIYFLNLNHPELSEEVSATSVLACPKGVAPSTKVLHAFNIYKDVWTGFFEDSPYGQVVRFLKGQGLAFFQLLQSMLETCAAYLLSTCWSELVRLPINKPVGVQFQAQTQRLQVLISKNLRSSRLPPGSDGAPCAFLLDGLFRGAYDLAAGIKEQLRHAPGVPFESMDFVIIPRPLKSCYTPIALLALPKFPNGWRSGLVIEPNADERMRPQYFSCEAEIPLKDRYRLGLLTQPDSKVKAT
jgi:DNA-binding MarR family transcriptional regulator